jgi:hypothetical protein
MFVMAEANAHVRFRRAIERRALWAAEDAARELPNLPLEDALQLVHLYAERGSPTFEKAAMRWLERYLTEGSPKLQHFVEVAMSLVKRDPELASYLRIEERELEPGVAEPRTYSDAEGATPLGTE